MGVLLAFLEGKSLGIQEYVYLDSLFLELAHKCLFKLTVLHLRLMDVQELDHLAQIYVFSHFLHESLISDKQKLFKVVALFNFFLLPVGV